MTTREPFRITVTAAEQHEALHTRLADLAARTQAIATRRPEEEVPPAIGAQAESLMIEARPYLPRGDRRRGVPAAPLHYGALAVALGQVLAALDAFELRHSSWEPALKCFVWHVAGPKLPIRRLRPEIVSPYVNAVQRAESEKMHARIMRRFDERYEDGLRAGRAEVAAAAAAAGQPAADPPPARIGPRLTV